MTTKDINGDGMVGALYYNRGHVTLRRSMYTRIVKLILAAVALFAVFVVIGSAMHVKSAQNVLETLVAGRE